jgi:hypothetical protein
LRGSLREFGLRTYLTAKRFRINTRRRPPIFSSV